ncbi:hypothetical protein [Ferrovibrio sp.]|uniref:hypothetical protein n=1 Tax=Ferrovibrio sp. TaxID=1917215 RepID=UPI0035B04E41
MGVFTYKSSIDSCWLCHSSMKPSREHKFKATDIRRHFGSDSMYVATFSGDKRARLAQGPNSKNLKYRSVICENCNSSVTQESDFAYDSFIRAIEKNDATGFGAHLVWQQEEFKEGGSLYIPLFRYFAKLLGCHLADIEAPIPRHLIRFVKKETERNCIFLDIRSDPTYATLDARLQNERLKFAAHGGLVVITGGPKALPRRLHSTLSIGKFQFIYEYNYTKFEIWEMQVIQREFIKLCVTASQKAVSNPLAEADLDRLGL